MPNRARLGLQIRDDHASPPGGQTEGIVITSDSQDLPCLGFSRESIMVFAVNKLNMVG